MGVPYKIWHWNENEKIHNCWLFYVMSVYVKPSYLAENSIFHQYNFLRYNRRTYHIWGHHILMSHIKSNEKQSDTSEGSKNVKPKVCFNQSFFLYSKVKPNSCIFRYQLWIKWNRQRTIITDDHINNTAWWIAI